MAETVTHTGIPGGDANVHLRSIPACAAMDMRAFRVNGRPTGLRIGADVAAARDGAGRVDPGAALLLADQATANGVFATLSTPVPMMTLALRVDWLAPLPVGALRSEMRDVLREGDLTLARGLLFGDDGPVGSIMARYLLGAMPGGGTGIEPGDDSYPTSPAGSFADYLGAIADGDRMTVAPRQEHIGARALPAFHGGVIAALLNRAGTAKVGDMRPIDVEVRFLSPARADRPLIAVATPQKIGRRAVTVDVAAYQEAPDRPVAIARLLAMADAPGAVSVSDFR